ncbi:MAG: SurA N-terminal domain-containing protein [Rhodobacteraceae bacterium]|nr:SurA N-terminal domain-containing protein [Paracoccaceae bacterium]
MAKALRSKSTNVFVWILMLLLIVGLAGFGAGSFGGSFSSIGSVGDEKVPLKTYIRALNNQLSQISQQTGQQFSLEQAKVLGVDRQVLEQVLAIAALDGQTIKAGISVGDEAVRNQLMDTQVFQGLDGKFDEKAYEFALSQADLSASEYDEILRRENARLLLQNAISGAIISDDTYALTLLKFHRQKRSFDWVRLNSSHLEKPVPEPSGAQIELFYKENPKNYTLPESRNITYAYLSPEMLFEGINLEKDELKKLYQDNIDQYVVEEKRSIQRLVFSNQTEATIALSSIQDGDKTFEQLVTERGLTLQDIDLGAIGASEIGLQASKEIFGSKETGLYGPHLSDLGPALYQVVSILNGKTISFEEAQKNLEFERKFEYATELMDDMVNDLDDLLASGATIEELANDTVMELKKTSFNLKNDLEGLEATSEFKIEASKLSLEDYPTLLNSSNGDLFAIRLDALNPPTLQALEKVEAQVTTDWKKKETINQLKLIANDIAAKFKNGSDLKNLGLIVNNTNDIVRGGSVEGLPKSILPKIFNLNMGEIAQDDTDNYIFIAKLNSILEFDETAEENRKWIEYLTLQRDNQLAQDYLESFIVSIQDIEGVTIDQKSLNAVESSLN